MNISIKAIEFSLPENQVTNEDLQREFPNWDMAKIAEKSGVHSRFISSVHETALDLSIRAVEKLLASQVLEKEKIGGILFCTQSPDYIMPSNAFLIHKHFGFGERVWAFDFNLACSGFVYGLAIARGMMSTNLANHVLLINADTYSKFIGKNDRSTRTLFGDGAAATLLSKTVNGGISDLILASSGENYESFFIPAGGCRLPKNPNTERVVADPSGNLKSLEQIHMNGFAVWKFISNTVPKQIKELLKNNNLLIDDIDCFIFHQASKMTLDSLSKALSLSENKVFKNLDRVGNTVSASIPIALKMAEQNGQLKRGDRVLLSGFGVGLSWGSALMIY